MTTISIKEEINPSLELNSVYSKKTKLDKNIVEVNVPEEVAPLLKMIEQKFV